MVESTHAPASRLTCNLVLNDWLVQLVRSVLERFTRQAGEVCGTPKQVSRRLSGYFRVTG
jgi:hypothetical protein